MGKNGAKNLLCRTFTSQTINGITFTVNSDRSITCNGTATGGELNLSNAKIFESSLPAGTYIVSCEQPENFQGAGLAYRINNGTPIYIVGEKTFTITDSDVLTLNLYAGVGYGWSNFTYYPMIRLATDHDSTYQPYAMTNKELTGAVAQINTDLTAIDTRQDLNNIGTLVDISTYTQNSPYTLPCDGYVLAASFVNPGYWQVGVTPADGDTPKSLTITGANGYANTLFVKKGMKAYLHGNSGNGQAYFFPLV
jgi:hypothetical protein